MLAYLEVQEETEGEAAAENTASGKLSKNGCLRTCRVVANIIVNK